MQNFLANILAAKPLKPQELQSIFSQMLKGELPESLIAAYLVAWNLLGEGDELLFAGAKELRSHAVKVDRSAIPRPLSDNCGTGGSGFPKFNVSTAAAIVSAAMGIKVAKHGNRSVSGVCGSADVLFAAGLKDNLSGEKTLALLKETGFGFFFAPGWHPSMRNVMPTRKALGVRSVFNLLGPLANPLQPDYQVLGVAQKKYLLPMAKTLAKLGIKKALVVHSRDGLDEISASSPTDMILVQKRSLKTQTFFPEKAKISGQKTQLRSNGVESNLHMLWKLLRGETSPVANAVALNSGALLWLNGEVGSLLEGFKLTNEKIKSKTCAGYFKDWLALAKTYE